jgi:hypothetical protein
VKRTIHAETGTQEEASYLFLVRLWPGEAAGGHGPWHGKVQNVLYGETDSFDNLTALTECLLSLLPALDTTAEPGDTEDTEENEQC